MFIARPLNRNPSPSGRHKSDRFPAKQDLMRLALPLSTNRLGVFSGGEPLEADL